MASSLTAYTLAMASWISDGAAMIAAFSVLISATGAACPGAPVDAVVDFELPQLTATTRSAASATVRLSDFADE